MIGFAQNSSLAICSYRCWSPWHSSLISIILCRQLLVDMNLKMESITSVHPSWLWNADALKPDKIFSCCLWRFIGFWTSKKRGTLPICLRLVSLKAYLMMMLIKFWLTELSEFSKSPLSWTMLWVDLSIKMVYFPPLKFASNSTSFSISSSR